MDPLSQRWVKSYACLVTGIGIEQTTLYHHKAKDAKPQNMAHSIAVKLRLSSCRRPVIKRHTRLWPGNKVLLFY
jgi:hypothetical protein